MSDKSPLFVSALELLAHATELYASGHTKKYKFVILHLANSVELILKDCLLDNGISIYKNPKETITIWGAFDELDKIKIATPEKPIIELLIDDRNTIQHRFGFPNAEAVFYYLENVVSFFSRFLEHHYEITLYEVLEPHLSRENLALIGLIKDDYNHLRRLFQISPEAAIQQSYSLIEGKLRDLMLPTEIQTKQEIFTRTVSPLWQMKILMKEGFFSSDLIEEFDKLRHARNRAAHMASAEITDVEWKSLLEMAIKILGVLDKVTRTSQSENGSMTSSAS